jgi:hypothetical protein
MSLLRAVAKFSRKFIFEHDRLGNDYGGGAEAVLELRSRHQSR